MARKKLLKKGVGIPHINERKRAKKIFSILSRKYPNAHIALRYGNPVQLLVAVILSAQCTDKKVNEVTELLFKKYKTAGDFADAHPAILEREIRSTGFYRAKAQSVISACKMLEADFGGAVPSAMEDILKLRGVARKTANVVLGNAYGIVEGIAVDTHVRRLSQRLGFTAHNDPVKIEKDLMVLFPKKDWFHLTYLLIDHGRTLCKAPIPRCESCPVMPLCPTGRDRLGVRRSARISVR